MSDHIMEGPQNTMGMIPREGYDTNVDYIISDYMERLGTRLNILETELKYAWRALDLLSQEYIKMWERLEKLEGLLYEQQSVISQLLDFYTSGGHNMENETDVVALNNRLGELEVIREILGNGTVEDGLEEGVDVSRNALLQQGNIQLEMVDEIHVPDEAFYRSLNQAYREDLGCENSMPQSQLGMIWEEREDSDENGLSEKKDEIKALEDEIRLEDHEDRIRQEQFDESIRIEELMDNQHQEQDVFSAMDYKDYRGNSPCVSEQDLAQLSRISSIDQVTIDKLNELDRLSCKLQQDSMNIKQLQRKLMESPHSKPSIEELQAEENALTEEKTIIEEQLRQVFAQDDSAWVFNTSNVDISNMNALSSTVLNQRPSSRLSVTDNDIEVAETLAGGMKTPTSPRRRQHDIITTCNAPFTTVTGRLAYSTAVHNAENAETVPQPKFNPMNPFYSSIADEFNTELSSLMAASYETCSTSNVFSLAKSEKAISPTPSVCSVRTRQDGYIGAETEREVGEEPILPNPEGLLQAMGQEPQSSPKVSPKRSKSHGGIGTAKSDSGLSSMSGWSSLEKSPGSPKNGTVGNKHPYYTSDSKLANLKGVYVETNLDTSNKVPTCSSILPGGHHLSAFTTVKSPCSLETSEGYGTFVPAPAPASDINVSPRRKQKAKEETQFMSRNDQPAIYSVAGSNRQDAYTSVYTSNSADYINQTVHYPDLIEPYEHNEISSRTYPNYHAPATSSIDNESPRRPSSRGYSTSPFDGVANHEGYKMAMQRTMFPSGNITDALSYYPTSTRYDSANEFNPFVENVQMSGYPLDSSSTSTSLRSGDPSESGFSHSPYSERRHNRGHYDTSKLVQDGHKQQELSRLSHQDINRLVQQDVSRMSQQDINRLVQQDISKLSQHDINRMSQQDINRLVQQDINRMSQQDINRLVQQDINKMSQHDISRMSQQDINRLVQQDMTRMSQQDINRLVQQDINRMSQQDINRLVQQDINKMSQQDINRLVQQDLSRMSQQELARLTQQDISRLSQQEIRMLQQIQQDQRYIQDPRLQDLRSQDPRYQDPRFQDNRSPDSRNSSPRHMDPRLMQDPRLQDPRFQEHARMQDPRYLEMEKEQPIYENQAIADQYRAYNAPYLDLDLRNRNIPDYIVQQQQQHGGYYDSGLVSQAGYITISDGAQEVPKQNKKIKRHNTLKSAMSSVSHWLPDLHLTKRSRSYSLPSGVRREDLLEDPNNKNIQQIKMSRKKKKNVLVSTMSGILQKAKKKTMNHHSQSLSDPEQSENEWTLQRASSVLSEDDRSEDSYSVFSDCQYENSNLFEKVISSKNKNRKGSLVQQSNHHQQGYNHQQNFSQMVQPVMSTTNNQTQKDINKEFGEERDETKSDKEDENIFEAMSHLVPKAQSIESTTPNQDTDASENYGNDEEISGKSTGSGTSSIFPTVGDVKRNSAASEKSEDSNTSESKFPQVPIGGSMEFAVSRALGKYRQRQTTSESENDNNGVVNKSVDMTFPPEPLEPAPKPTLERKTSLQSTPTFINTQNHVNGTSQNETEVNIIPIKHHHPPLQGQRSFDVSHGHELIKNYSEETSNNVESSPISSTKMHLNRMLTRHQQSLEIPGFRGDDDDNKSTHSWRSTSRVSSRRQSTEDSIDSEDEWYCYELKKLEEMERQSQLEAELGETLEEVPEVEDSFEPAEEVKEKMSFVLRELRMKAKVVEGVLDDEDNKRHVITSAKNRENQRKSMQDDEFAAQFAKVSDYHGWKTKEEEERELEQMEEYVERDAQEDYRQPEVVDKKRKERKDSSRSEDDEHSSGDTSGPDSPHMSMDEYEEGEIASEDFQRCPRGSYQDEERVGDGNDTSGGLPTIHIDNSSCLSKDGPKEELGKDAGVLGSKWKLLKALKERKAEEKSNQEKINETTTEKDKNGTGIGGESGGRANGPTSSTLTSERSLTPRPLADEASQS